MISAYARSHLAAVDVRDLIARVDRLQRLAAFDAAARSESFTAASTDLAVSQPAITRQIAALERSLGVQLFERSPNRVSLTDDGRRLAEAVESGFSTIERAIDDLAGAATIVIASTPGFAQELIVPDLVELQDALGEIDIRLWLYDRDADLRGGGYDVAVRIGDGDWPHDDATELFAERVVPVAAPALAEHLELLGNTDPQRVLDAPLLHMDADRPWMSWRDWLARFDLQLTPGRRRVLINSYPTVVQQALAGHGVALGWRRLIDRYLTDEMLVEVGPEVTSSGSYHLAWPATRSSPTVELVVEWLASRADSTGSVQPP